MLKAINEDSKYNNKYEVSIRGVAEIPYGYITVKANSLEQAVIFVLKHFGYAGVLTTGSHRKQEATAHVKSYNEKGIKHSIIFDIVKLKRVRGGYNG